MAIRYRPKHREYPTSTSPPVHVTCSIQLYALGRCSGRSRCLKLRIVGHHRWEVSTTRRIDGASLLRAGDQVLDPLTKCWTCSSYDLIVASRKLSRITSLRAFYPCCLTDEFADLQVPPNGAAESARLHHWFSDCQWEHYSLIKHVYDSPQAAPKQCLRFRPLLECTFDLLILGWAFNEHALPSKVSPLFS